MIKISVRDLYKKYSTGDVFSGLSFDYSGGIVGIAGANGSGKTTLLRCISGLTSPTGGSVEWTIDQEAYKPEKLRPFLGFAAPYIQLYEELTARENLVFIRELRDSRLCTDISTITDQFEIRNFENSLFGQLSSGQQQRVKLAAAAIHNPGILCLDEPGTNLDRAGHQLVQRITGECLKREGIVFIASNQEEELKLCDHIIDLN